MTLESPNTSNRAGLVDWKAAVLELTVLSAVCLVATWGIAPPWWAALLLVTVALTRYLAIGAARRFARAIPRASVGKGGQLSLPALAALFVAVVGSRFLRTGSLTLFLAAGALVGVLSAFGVSKLPRRSAAAGWAQR